MKTHHAILATAAAFLLVAVHPAAAQRGEARPVTPERAYLNAMFDNIKGVEIFNCVRLLSDSTLFQGRLSGSEGMRRAVDWVSSRYAEIGLEPVPGLNGYSQDYPVSCTEVAGPCSLTVDGRTCLWAKEWFAGGTSANGIAEAEVVFAGFGVSAPELGYDDYAGIDVRGKIVLIEGETPNTSRNDDTLRIWYPYTLHQYKVANAVAHGAIGMLYRWVPGPNNGYDPGFVYAYITDELADSLVEGKGKDFQSLIRQLRVQKKPASFATGKKACIQMTMSHREDAVGHNLLGMVRGSDPQLCNEYVILSAHLDHLGMVPYHIAGANDNNSSTACLLAVAKALQESKVKPKRSVIFLSLDGEEAGLTGSLYLTAHPVVPAQSVKFILNLEQVGIGNAFSVGYKYDNPEIREYVQKANDQYIHRPLGFYPNRYVTRPRTDGAVFMKNGYPTVDFYSVGGRSYYHEPRDSWEIQDPSILEDAARAMFWSILNAANATDAR